MRGLESGEVKGCSEYSLEMLSQLGGHLELLRELWNPSIAASTFVFGEWSSISCTWSIMKIRRNTVSKM